MGASGFDVSMSLVTIWCVGGVAVFTKGMTQRLLILIGLILACVIYALLAKEFNDGKTIDTSMNP